MYWFLDLALDPPWNIPNNTLLDFEVSEPLWYGCVWMWMTVYVCVHMHGHEYTEKKKKKTAYKCTNYSIFAVSFSLQSSLSFVTWKSVRVIRLSPPHFQYNIRIYHLRKRAKSYHFHFLLYLCTHFLLIIE